MNKIKILLVKFLRNLIFIIYIRRLSMLSTEQYLTHHWPISNRGMHDVIGMAHMTQGSSAVTFCQDRYGTLGSAINLSNKSFTEVPSGIYFDSPTFTISVWIYPLNPSTNWTRVIDFGNGAGIDNLFLSFGSNNGILHPAISIRKVKRLITNTLSPQALASSQWQLLTATFDGNQTHIYINGSLMNSANVNYSSTSLNRTKNYIGKSHWDHDGFSDSLLDDLRFYNKSLNQAEIIDLAKVYDQENRASIFSLNTSKIIFLNENNEFWLRFEIGFRKPIKPDIPYFKIIGFFLFF